MKIVALDVKNVKRVRAVHVEPDGSAVVIGGANGAGKTSVLDAITMALAGAKAIPGVPLRQGEKRGEVRVDLGEVVVTRTFTEAGGGTLTIEKSGEAAKLKSPQAWLDARIGTLSFDPLDFMRQKPRDQADTIRRLVGVDVTTLDAERADVFARRTEINRQVRDAEGALANMPMHPDAPKEPVTTGLLAQELDAAMRINEAKREAERTATDAEREVETARAGLVGFDSSAEARRAAAAGGVTSARNEVARCKAALVEAERAWTLAEQTVSAVESSIAADRERIIVEGRDKADRAKTLRGAAAALPTADEAAVLAKFGEAEAVNGKVAANAARAEAGRRASALGQQALTLTDRLAEIDAQKAALLAAAAFPVPGLSFGEGGVVTFNGLPLEQASGAEKIRVSMAVALALNPTLRVVLIRDASLLDADSLRTVAEMAAERDAQVWLERVGDGDPGAVVIEDGEVRPC